MAGIGQEGQRGEGHGPDHLDDEQEAVRRQGHLQDAP
jgi:hypothetical protein